MSSNVSEESKKPLHKRKWFVLSTSLLSLIFLIDLSLVMFTHGGNRTVDILGPATDQEVLPAKTISVLSINLAHGRANGVHQMLQGEGKISKHLEMVCELINREGVNLVALQEADRHCWWSGGFSHVEELSEATDLSYSAHAANVDGLGLSYGTAIISKEPMIKARQLTFPRNYPTLSKGCIISTCSWPGDDDFRFLAVSVHLDFASESARAEQLGLLSEEIAKLALPVIVLGDFNTDSRDASFTRFVEDLGLSTWEVENFSWITFPSMNRRLDWIMVSKEFQLREFEVLPDVVSDHLAIKAVLQRADEAQRSSISF